MADIFQKLIAFESGECGKWDSEKVRQICTLVRKAVALIDKIFDIFRGTTTFSFNGGKDSTVVLHLLRLTVHIRGTRGLTSPTLSDGCSSFYFDSNSCFKEEKDFVQSTCVQYGMDLMRLNHNFKEGLEILTEVHGVRAIFMGTRNTDPDGVDIDVLSTSSPGWPAFLRVNPCLLWGFHDVWAFLRIFEIPYCILYDSGYTSIGSRDRTCPNEALKNEDGSYKAAFMLEDVKTERSGSRKSVSE